MKKILFVCSGNTCRSPMAAALFNALGDPEFYCHSAGIGAYRGDGISRGALDALRFTATPICQENPYPDHLSKPITEQDIAEAEAVYGMTGAHARKLQEAFVDHKDKIFPFPLEISDPVGKDTGAYLNCLAEIRLGISRLYRELKNAADGIYPGVAEWDLADILKIENESFSTPWSEKSFLLSLENPITHTLVQIADGKVAGYALYSVLFEDGELYNIATAPTARGKGYGQALLTRVIAESQQRGCDVLRLEVRSSNTPAKTLYEKNGFVAEGVRKNYYKNPTEDAILMHLPIKKETV